MSDILFIRHAETDMAGTFCGHSDPPVNQRGQAQIQTLLASIDLRQIDCIYSSDLQRATATAHAIANTHNLPVHPSTALREIHFGAWEGLTWQQIEQRDPAYARSWTEEFPNLPAPGGETFADFQARILNAIELLSPPPSNNRTVIVTHAGVMRVVLAASSCCTEQQAWERTRAYCSTFTYQRPAGLQQRVP